MKKRALMLLLGMTTLAALGGCSSDTSDPVSDKPVPNPWLAAAHYAITHFDSSQSDSTPYGPPSGTFQMDPSQYAISPGGPVNIMTLASTLKDFMWGVGTDHVAFIEKGTWRTRAHLNAPAYVDPSLGPIASETFRAFGELNPVGMTSTDMHLRLSADFGANYSARLVNGAYSVVDRNNILYANFGNGVYAFTLTDAADPSRGIRILHRLDDARTVQGGTPPASVMIQGLTFTYDGYLIITFRNGVAVVDRTLDVASAHFVPFGPQEQVTNSVAVDEKNGIYVASDKLMRKLVWTGKTLSERAEDGAWSSPYDAPDDALPPMVKFGLGTGSTPTLMGFGPDPDKLVVITDGAKRMKLVAFWRDEIPAGFVQRPGTASARIAGQIDVTCGLPAATPWIQSEQSVVVSHYGAFVVNNIPATADSMDIAHSSKILAVSLMGPVYDSCFGVERFRWNPDSDSWSSVWRRPDVSSTSMVPIHSQSSTMALVNGYTRERGWEVTGMNWDTGATVHQTLFGRKNLGNGAYAILEYLENGDLLFNSIVGPLRVLYPH